MKHYAYNLRKRLSFYQESYPLFKTVKSAGFFYSNMGYYFSLKSSLTISKESVHNLFLLVLFCDSI